MLNYQYNKEYYMNKDKEYPAEDVFGDWFTTWVD